MWKSTTNSMQTHPPISTSQIFYDDRRVYFRVKSCLSYRLLLPLHAVTKTPKHHHITRVLKSLHVLKVPQRIHYKIVSLTYKRPTLKSSNLSALSHSPITHHTTARVY